MIDAATFAISYNAFWKAFTPTCEFFVRRLNLDGYERVFVPMSTTSAQNRNALTAEYAFSLFAANAAMPSFVSLLDDQKHAVAMTEVRSRLGGYASTGLDLNSPLTVDEEVEIEEIHDRLTSYFSTRKAGSVSVRPLYLGCGFVDTSEGDVISEDTIFEVKTVDRTFRSIDIRQLVTYAALNFVSKQYEVTHLGLFNPRRGVACELELEHVSEEISGRPAAELLSIIVSTISSGDISR